MIYRVLDIFFLVFHTSLVVFNVFGWIWKRTRKLNLLTLLLTGSSWLFLGLIVGTIGYCPLTDLHFRVLEKLGHTDLPFSYMKYLFDRITGISLADPFADKVTLAVFIAALLFSLIFNARDYLLKRHKGTFRN
jgi:hypothetical protein